MTLAGLIIYLGVLPIFGVVTAQNMRRLLLSDTPPSRPSLYVNALVTQWGIVFAILLAMRASGAPLAPIGLSVTVSLTFWAGLICVAVLYAALLVVRARAEASSSFRAWLLRQTPPIVRRVAPATPSDLRLFAPVALTAGVCEEILFRGIPFHLLSDLPPPLVIAITAVSFGTLHLYQGRTGVIVTTVGGILFGCLYWASNALLPVMILHALYNWEVARLHLLLTEAE